jgi:hypothetical protein
VVKSLVLFIFILLFSQANMKAQGHLNFGFSNPVVQLYNEDIPGFYVGLGTEFFKIKGSFNYVSYPRNYEQRVSDHSICASLGYKFSVTKSMRLEITPGILGESRKYTNRSLGSGEFGWWSGSVAGMLDVGYVIGDRWKLKSISTIGKNSREEVVSPFLTSLGIEFIFRKE